MQRNFFTHTVFLYTLCVLIWGSTWYAVKLQMVGIAPELSVAYRFGFASLLLFLFSWLSKKSLKYNLGTHLQFLLIGFFGYFASYICSYKGVEHTTSGVIAVFYSTIPFFNAFASKLILKKKLESRLLIASALGFSGVLFIFWNEFQRVSDSSALLQGLFFSLLGACASALANVLVFRGSELRVPVAVNNAYSMGYSALLTFVFCLAEGKFLSPLAWMEAAGLQYFVSFSFLVLFGSMISFGAYYTLQYRIGATRASYMTILFPILALTYSTILEGYQWNILGVLGLLSVMVGLILTFQTKQPKFNFLGLKTSRVDR